MGVRRTPQVRLGTEEYGSIPVAPPNWFNPALQPQSLAVIRTRTSLADTTYPPGIPTIPDFSTGRSTGRARRRRASIDPSRKLSQQVGIAQKVRIPTGLSLIDPVDYQRFPPARSVSFVTWVGKGSQSSLTRPWVKVYERDAVATACKTPPVRQYFFIIAAIQLIFLRRYAG